MDELAERVKSIIAEHLDIDKGRVTESASIRDLVADSLDALEIIMGLEEEFSILIPDGVADKIGTVEDAINSVEDTRSLDWAALTRAYAHKPVIWEWINFETDQDDKADAHTPHPSDLAAGLTPGPPTEPERKDERARAFEKLRAGWLRWCRQEYEGLQHRGMLESLSASAQEHYFGSEWLEDPDDHLCAFQEGLDNVRSFVDSLAYALNQDALNMDDQEADPTVEWTHHKVPLKWVQTKNTPYMDRDLIEEAAQEYLGLPFRSDAADRLLIDILIAMELYGFAEEMINTGVDSAGPLRMLDAPQPPLFSVKNHPIRRFIRWRFWSGVVFGVPAAGFYFLGGQQGWTSWVALGLAGLFLAESLLTFVVLPAQIKLHTKQQVEARDLLLAMNDTYGELSGSGPFSVAHIRQKVDDSSSKGVVWPSVLFVLLDDIALRTPRF